MRDTDPLHRATNSSTVAGKHTPTPGGTAAQMPTTDATAQDPGAAIVSQLLESTSRAHALSHLAEALRQEMASPEWPAKDADSILLKVLRAQRGLLSTVRERLHKELQSLASVLVPAVARLIPTRSGSDLHFLLDLARSLASPTLLPVLTPVLVSPDEMAAALALQAIAAVRTPEATAVIVGALDRADLRWAAVGLVADFRISEAIKPLGRCLSDPSAEVRLEAVRALTRLADTRTLPWLRTVFERDPDQRIREAARDAIRRISVHHGLAYDERALVAASAVTLHSDRLMDRILAEARMAGASDVHLVAGAPLAFRVHGRVTEPLLEALGPASRGAALTAQDVEDLVRPIIPKRLVPVFERDLQADFSYAVPGLGRHRVNVFMERRGMAAVIRLIPSEVPSLAALGLPPQVKDVTTFHQGLVIVTGRSGSGKTTTLAALVNLINETRAAHIITLEDPIEYLHPRKRGLVNQREVGRHTLSFSAALRAALREDPDVIVVGEMRDLVTIRLAVEAAETGHLVLATLHTPDAVGAVTRLIEAFPAAEQQQVRLMVSDSLRMVIAQSLVPAKEGTGRVGCFEILVCTPAVANLIRENKMAQIPGLLQTGQAQGMRTLDSALMDLVQAGRIAPEEAYMRAVNKDLFRPMLRSQDSERGDA